MTELSVELESADQLSTQIVIFKSRITAVECRWFPAAVTTDGTRGSSGGQGEGADGAWMVVVGQRISAGATEVPVILTRRTTQEAAWWVQDVW